MPRKTKSRLMPVEAYPMMGGRMANPPSMRSRRGRAATGIRGTQIQHGDIKRRGKKRNPPLLTVWPNPGAQFDPKYGQIVETYKGHTIYFLNSSYNVPSLGLYGYASDTSLKRAITRRLSHQKKAGKYYWKNPGSGSRPPFRSGQQISIEQFEQWLRTQPQKIRSAYKKALKQYMKFHLGSRPTSISFDMVDIGGSQVLEPEILYSAGQGPTETYTPERGSGKAPHSYVHEYKTMPPVLVGGKKGRQFVLKPLHGSARVDDWFRG